MYIKESTNLIIICINTQRNCLSCEKKGPKAFYNIEIINVSLKHTQYWKIVILAFQNSITKKNCRQLRDKSTSELIKCRPLLLGNECHKCLRQSCIFLDSLRKDVKEISLSVSEGCKARARPWDRVQPSIAGSP